MREADDDGWQQPIKDTKWFQTYSGAVKKSLCVLAQQVDGVIEVMCIDGGPITQVERATMPTLLYEAEQDSQKSGVVLQTNMRCMSYRDFHDLAQSFKRDDTPVENKQLSVGRQSCAL